MDNELNISMLHMIEHPAFIVQDGVVIHSNQGAKALLIPVGSPIEDLLQGDTEDYSQFSHGCLYLTVSACGVRHSTTVTRLGNVDLFILQKDDARLEAFALAATHLRVPLVDIMAAVDHLNSEKLASGEALSGLNKGINQLNRLINNMADVHQYRQGADEHRETIDIPSFFHELMEKLSVVMQYSDRVLRYHGLNEIYTAFADPVLLERAVSNMLANAIKYSSFGDTLEATLTQHGQSIRFSLIGPSNNSQEEPHCNPFTRYARIPAIEDHRNGMGLGLPLVAAIAAIHGGTALLDHPEDGVTRVSFTIRQYSSNSTEVHSPVLLPHSDYAGGRDRLLLEFSDILPKQAYTTIK